VTTIESATLGDISWRYRGIGTHTATFDVLELSSYFADFGGPTQPGSYSFADSNYATCGLCLLAFEDCDSWGCRKVFYADAGELNIVDLGQAGGKFSGNIHQVVLHEVTIDAETYVSTHVPDGKSWCIEDYAFDVTISESQQ